MIICSKRKIGVFLIPKTGTVTLTKLFKNVDVDVKDHQHTNFAQMMSDYGTKFSDLETYRFFAFYRDPVDRLISSLRYQRRTLYPSVIHFFYGNEIKISCLCQTPYTELADNIKVAIEALSNLQLLESHFCDRGTALFAPQVNWLNQPTLNMTYLNYHNYDAEVRRLMAEFDCYDFEIPILNQSVKLASDVLTEPEIQLIQQRYADDIAFLASKGLTT